MPGLRQHITLTQTSTIQRSQPWILWSSSAFICLLALTACPQDQTALQGEALQLKKQTAKLESVIQTLQEGNKVLQQQIDRLNQEARESEATFQLQMQEAESRIASLAKAPKKDVETIQSLEKKVTKLTKDAQWLRSQRERMRKSLVIQQIGGQTHELPFSFSSVSSIMDEAFTKNGYTILTTMQTDKKAVYITDRKTSLPPSLELSGFRNQYLAMIEKGPADHTTIWIRAEFEKLSRNGHIFAAPQAELSEIESRLIQEIHQTLVKRNTAQAKTF